MCFSNLTVFQPGGSLYYPAQRKSSGVMVSTFMSRRFCQRRLNKPDALTWQRRRMCFSNLTVFQPGGSLYYPAQRKSSGVMVSTFMSRRFCQRRLNKPDALTWLISRRKATTTLARAKKVVSANIKNGGAALLVLSTILLQTVMQTSGRLRLRN